MLKAPLHPVPKLHGHPKSINKLPLNESQKWAQELLAPAPLPMKYGKFRGICLTESFFDVDLND